MEDQFDLVSFRLNQEKIVLTVKGFKEDIN